MSKITLSNIGSIPDNPTSAANTIDTNNATIQAAFDNTLSRDGTSPNTMASTLDMDSNRIVNLPAPVGLTEPLRLTDANTLNGGGTIQAIPTGGTSGQVLTKNSSTNYDVSWSASTSTGRTQLLANRTYYVRTGGNDSNTGLVNDDAHALATFNKGIDLISALDFNGFNVTLMAGNVGATYTNNPILINKAWAGTGLLTIDLNGGTVTSNTTKALLNTIIIPNAGATFGTGPGNILVQNGTLSSSVFSAVQNAGVGTLLIGANMSLQYAEYALEATGTGAIINVGSGTYNILASTGTGLVGALYGASVYAVSTVFNITGNISSTAGTFYALDAGIIAATSCSFTGAGVVTGPRFLADAGIIETVGGLNLIPGSSAGYAINGGVYKNSTGTAAQPAMNVSSTAGYGFFTPAANQFGIAVGGTNQLDYGITNASKWTFNAVPVTTTLASTSSLTFLTNTSGLAATVTSGQKWGFGTETNPQATFVVSNNVTTGLVVSGAMASFIAADSNSALVRLDTYGTGVNSSFVLNSSRGTAASPTSSQNGDILGFFQAAGRANSTSPSAGNGLAAFASENYTLTTTGAYLQALITNTGTTNRIPSVTFQASGGLSIGGQTLGAPANDPGAGGLNITGTATLNSAVATPAGGSTSARLLFGTTAGFGIYYGSGAPTVSAAQGSIYIRSDGSSTSTRLYVNTTGSTTWTNFTSAT